MSFSTIGIPKNLVPPTTSIFIMSSPIYLGYLHIQDDNTSIYSKKETFQRITLDKASFYAIIFLLFSVLSAASKNHSEVSHFVVIVKCEGNAVAILIAIVQAKLSFF